MNAHSQQQTTATPRQTEFAFPSTFNWEDEIPASRLSFTVLETAKYMACSKMHVINLIDEGTIKAADIRGKESTKTQRRIPRSELVRYLNSRTL